MKNDNATSAPVPELPLAGIRVIDMTTVIFGPACTQVLADYGADVIKVEAPEGDFSRHAGPSPVEGLGPMYLNLNRNKRSIRLDLNKDNARDALLALCAKADMFVSNVRPAGLARLGLGYEALCAVKPDIVYLSLVGYGQDGPYASRPAVDDVLQAGSGICDLFTRSLGGDPAYIPMNIADRLAGVTAVHAAMAALFMRQRTGRSQFVEVPMYETMVATVMGDHLMGESFMPAAGEMGYSRILSRARQPFRTLDGFVSTAIYTEKHWNTFLPAIGQGHLLHEDERFTNATSRAKHYPHVYQFLAGQFRQRSCEQWLEILTALDIPCSRVVALEQVIDDPHLAAVGMFPQVDHPVVGKVRDIRFPVRWDGVDLRTRQPAPSPGQHTREVLLEAGLDEAQVAELAGPARNKDFA